MRFKLAIDDEVLIEDILIRLVAIKKNKARLEITRTQRYGGEDGKDSEER